MSESKRKEDWLNKTLNERMTRRKFMKVSGKSLVGLTVSASVLSMMGCTQKQIDNGDVVLWDTPEGLLVVNQAKCTGCQRCEINCTTVNDGVVSSHISRVKVTRNLFDHNGHGTYQDDWTYYPDTCRQCEDPACGNACPEEAIYSNEKGIKLIDETKCIGCGECVEACPWNMPTVNPETKKASKCILCGACVDGCITGALSVVSWDKVTEEAQELRKAK